MRKIAILFASSHYYDDECHIIARSITDWQEVDDEDYAIISAYAHRKNLTILEQPTNQEDYLVNTIAEFKELAKTAEQRRLERIQIEEAKRLERARKKAMSAEEKERELFEKLKEKFEDKQKWFR